MKWIQASERPPLEFFKKFIAKRNDLLGWCYLTDANRLAFEHCKGRIEWGLRHEELQRVYYLDESPSPDPDILVRVLEECFAPGNLTVIGTMPSLYVEKLRLAYDEYKAALNQYKGT